MSSNPTLILNHGAWNGPECWTALISALQQQGYECIAPQLDFSGTEKPVDSLASSVHQIQGLIAAETTKGNDVVLINHSFGGAVGCSAVKGFTAKDTSRLDGDGAAKVLGIVQICAFMLPANTSIYDLISQASDEPPHHPDAEGWEILDNGDPLKLFYNDLPPEVGNHWKDKMKKQSTWAFTDRDNIYPGWKDVPVWYLHGKQDQIVPVQAQEAMVAAARAAGATVVTNYLDCGHCPFLGKLGDTVEFITSAVEEFLYSSPPFA
ncbi:hypothetical protein BBP40_009880 [Aspergillus hancockii]|nr:hypothetical protein BBP40_009880 [Aspergillus hancockii]